MDEEEQKTAKRSSEEMMMESLNAESQKSLPENMNNQDVSDYVYATSAFEDNRIKHIKYELKKIEQLLSQPKFNRSSSISIVRTDPIP